MAWPLSQDFNEAIQNPKSAFADPDLKAGKVTTTALGVPLPRSGNYADVYQVTGADGKSWAVKCFTRAVAPDLQARYAAIAGHLAQANLPFTIPMEFLPEGIRVKGKAYPVVKMHWVEGFALNSFVKENLNRATILESLLSLWVRLCRRLRESGMAHCDLQHGNVILVPGDAGKHKLDLKLVDYDGMFVPALAGKPTGEAGHASFQHPQRVSTNAYSADLDRFPHLVVATALRGLLVGGKALWDKYDTGDNLLFTAKDFAAPGQSKVMKELWDTGDPFTVGLLSHLVISCAKPLAGTPWLDTLMPEGRPPVLTPSQEKQAMDILGIANSGAAPATVPAQAAAPGAGWGTKAKPAPAAAVPNELGFEDSSVGSKHHKALETKKNPMLLYGGIAAGVLVVVGAIAFAFSGKKDPGSGAASASPASSSGAPASGGPPPTPVEPPPPTPKEADPPETSGDPPTLPMGVKVGKVQWTERFDSTKDDGPLTVAYTHDGEKIIVTQAKTGQIRVLDAKSGKVIATCKEHAPVDRVAAAPLPDGKVLSGGSEPVLIVWDDSTGKAAARVTARGPAGNIQALQTDRKGQYALVGVGSKASVIDLAGNREILELDLGGGAAANRTAAFLAPDGSGVLAITPANTLRTIPLPAGEAVEVKLALPAADKIMAWQPETNVAAVRVREETGAAVRKIHLVNVATGAVIKSIESARGRCSFTPDGAYLATTSTELRGFNYYDALTGELRGSVPMKNATVDDAAISPDGGRAVLLKVTNHDVSGVESPFGPSVLSKPSPMPVASAMPQIDSLAPVFALKESDLSGKSVSAATLDKNVKRVYYCDGEKIRAVDIAAKMEAFAVPASGKVRRLWSTDAGLIAEIVKPDDKVDLHIFDDKGAQTNVVEITGRVTPTMASVNEAGTQAVTARMNGTVNVYDLKTGKSTNSIAVWGKDKTPADATLTVFAAANKLLVNRHDRVILYAWQPPFNPNWASPGSYQAVEDFTDDDRRVIFRMTDSPTTSNFVCKRLHSEWKIPGGKFSLPIGGPAAAVRFLGNGQRVAAIMPGKLKIFDSEDGRELASLDSAHPAGTQLFAGAQRSGVVLAGGTHLAVFAGVPGTSVVGKTPSAVDPPTPVSTRKPVPPDDALKLAEAKVKEIYKDLYAKKLPSDRRKLAEQLLKTASETANDAAAKFFLLKEVQNIAVELNDASLGAKAIDAADADFDVDGVALRISLLERIGTSASKVDVLRGLAETCGEMVEDLAEKNEFDKALKLASVGLAALARANLQAIGRDLEARQNQLRRQRDAYEPVKAAFEKLKAAPNDPEANLLVGKYRCLVLGRWAEGLSNLALCGDEALKKAATLDLGSESNMKKADAWWTWAQTQADAEKLAALGRAKAFYAQVLSAGAAGLDRATAENRLSFNLAGTEYRPGLVLELHPYGGTKVAGAKKTVKLAGTADLTASDLKSGQPRDADRVGVKFLGYIVPPVAGRYRIIADGKSKVMIKVGTAPDQKTVIDVRAPDDPAAKTSALVVLPAKPVALYIESLLLFDGRGYTYGHSLKLKWLRPGAKNEELIPEDCLFHSKASETSLTERGP